MILASPAWLLCLPNAFGQLPARVEKCLPYPTLAQEIGDKQPTSQEVGARVHVLRVDFDSNDGVPPDVRREISAELQSHVFQPNAKSDYLSDLAREIAEGSAREALQNHGYFKALATAVLTKLQAQGQDVSVAVAIHATPGPQFRTGDIRVVPADSNDPLIVSPEILRNLIPLERGELFSVEKIRTGLDRVSVAYVREGYIDMTAEPDIAIDEAQAVIDLIVRIDRQVQYRVGSVEFLGLNNVDRETLLESLPKPGEIFDGTRLHDFLQVNRTILPPDASRDDVRVERDAKTRTVRILFDFWRCPQQSN